MAFLCVEPEVNSRGQVQNKTAEYQPDGREKTRLADIRRSFEVSDKIRHKPYEEFNNRDIVTTLGDSQRAYNNYVEEVEDDPDLSWRSDTRRGLTRNKIISIAAHITQTILGPTVTSQNDADEEDRKAAVVMNDLIEYTLEMSKYERAFFHSVIAMLVNPAAIVNLEYVEYLRKIKEVKEDGGWEEKEIVDPVFSGFQNAIIPVDEFFIGNIYEFDVQKQPFLIWRRVISYENAKIKYGDNENFEQFVTPGVRIFYNDQDDTFYEEYDRNIEETQVEEIVYYHRLADLELRIVNGVLMDDPDRPMQRKDKLYPFAKSGYELIDEGRFFYYRSLADKLREDQKLLDTLWNILMDGSILSMMPPSVILGNEDIDASVIVPGGVTTLRDANAFQTINTNNNLVAGMNAIDQVEKSMSESSTDPLQAGQSLQGQQTAFEIARIEQNAKTVLGLFGKNVIFFVKDYGDLLVPLILQHMTVPQVVDIIGDNMRLEFSSYLLEDRIIEGEKKPRRIDFQMLPTKEEDIKQMEIDLLMEETEKGMEIIKVNPSLFRNWRFKTTVNADPLTGRSDAVKRAIKLEAYQIAIANEFANREAMLRELVLEPALPGQSAELMQKPQEAQQGLPPQKQSGTVQELTKQQAVNEAL